MGMMDMLFRSGRSPGKAVPVIGDERQQLFDQLHGKHYNDCRLGRVWSQACTPLGLAIPIYTATGIAGGMPIWNTAGSGVNVELISVDIGYGSGTADFGSVGLMAQKATVASPSAFADTTPKNGYLGGGNADTGSAVRSSNAGTVTITASAAGDWHRTLASINLEAQTGTAHGTTIVHYDFDGTLIVPPGWLVWLAATKASVALYASCVVWKEIPVIAG